MSSGWVHKRQRCKRAVTSHDRRAIHGSKMSAENRRSEEQYQAKYGLARAQVKQAAKEARERPEWAHKAMKEGPADEDSQ